MPLERALAALTGGGRPAPAAGARRGGDRAARPARTSGGAAAGRARPGRAAREHDAPGGPARGDRGARPRGPRARASRASSSRWGCRTTPSGWPRCAKPSARGRRCAWTPTGPGRPTRPYARSARSRQHDLEFVEQPCQRLRELAEVRQRVSTPIAADESVASMRELRRALELEACDVVNVKLAGAGGFTPARELLREARANGLDAFLSSTLDGPWGIAAALQLAGVRGTLPGLRPRHARALRRPHRAGAAGTAARNALGPGRPGPGRPSRRGGARRGDGRGRGLSARRSSVCRYCGWGRGRAHAARAPANDRRAFPDRPNLARSRV